MQGSSASVRAGGGTRGSPLSPSSLPAESGMMNGPDLGPRAPSPAAQDEQAASGRDDKDNNPFAEYMWMENEEDFNRQVRAGRAPAPRFCASPRAGVPVVGPAARVPASTGPAPGGEGASWLYGICLRGHGG